MPRKPNYKFERAERDRAKALKKAKRNEDKAARQSQTPAGEDSPGADSSESDQEDKRDQN